MSASWEALLDGQKSAYQGQIRYLESRISDLEGERNKLFEQKSCGDLETELAETKADFDYLAGVITEHCSVFDGDAAYESLLADAVRQQATHLSATKQALRDLILAITTAYKRGATLIWQIDVARARAQKVLEEIEGK